MGKKRSVVLMILITIVTVVLCVLTLFPAIEVLPFRIDGQYRGWNPVVMQYDVGSDFEGGFYTYYYPEGVITESDYEDLADADEKAEYVAHKGLYLNKDKDFGIFDSDEDGLTSADVSADFISAFDASVKKIANRFEKKGYSDYSVDVIDDYAVRVWVSAAESNPTGVIAGFSLSGELTVQKGGAAIADLEGKNLGDYVKGFSHGVSNGYAYVEVDLTRQGKELVASIKDELSSASASGTEGAVSLDFGVQTESIKVFSEYVSSTNSIKVPVAEAKDAANAQAMAILFDTAIDGGLDVTFKTVTAESIMEHKSVYGENALLLTFIAFAVVLLACIVLPIVKYGKYGVTCMYSTLGYMIISLICFAFIAEGVFEITLGSALIFLVGLLLVNLFNVRIYDSIKAEFDLGKTVESSVKLGMKNVLFQIIDVYAVLVIGALALLIGVAGLNTMALQALICLIAGAFCNLLWHRLINAAMLATSKDKYKYFRFVRGDDDDE